MLKIFLVSNMYPTESNPSYGVFIKNIEEGLKREGIVFPFKSVIRGKGKNLLVRIKKYVKLYFSIFKYGLWGEYDIIYTHFVTHTLIPTLSIKCIKKKKIVANVHGSDLLEGNFITRVLRLFTGKFLNKADLIIVPSNYFKNLIMQKYHIGERKVCVSPSGGVDCGLFNPKDKRECKEKLDLDSRDFIIGFVSRIDKGKGWEILLKSLSIIKNQGIKFKSVTVGTGQEVESFLSQIKEFNLSEEVLYLGERKYEELPEIYNSFDVFVFPTTRAESLGLVGIEAMACGIPIIASKIGGIKEYIVDGENGFLFIPKKEKDLSNKILEFYKIQEEEKEKISRKCLLYSKKFCRNVIIKDLKNKLESLGALF